MARGGARPGAGRPKGPPRPPKPRNRKRTGRPGGRPKGAISKSTRAIIEAAQANSLTMLDIMMFNARRLFNAERYDEAAAAAALAAPYAHPKLTAIAQFRRPSEMTPDELRAFIADAKAAAGGLSGSGSGDGTAAGETRH